MIKNYNDRGIRFHGLFPLEWLNNHLKRYLFHNFYLRDMTIFMKDYFNGLDRGLVGVEIGVLYGLNSRLMLQHLDIDKLFCVDPYSDYGDYDIYNGDGDHNFEIAKNNLRFYKDKVKFLRLNSDVAVNSIPDGLDFVYIDGNHSYDFVKQDISLYWPKVRVGGVLGGHDFYAVQNKDYDVPRAVLEFVEREGLCLFGKLGYDWYVIKKKDGG